WSTTLPLPLVQYIARPDDFSGHVLALQGYLVADGVKGELFLSEADAANRLVANGVAIDFTGAHVPADRVAEVDHRFVTIIGRRAPAVAVPGAAGLVSSASVPLLRDIEAVEPAGAGLRPQPAPGSSP